MSAVTRLGRKNLFCAVPFSCLIARSCAQTACGSLPDGNVEARGTCVCFLGNAKFID